MAAAGDDVLQPYRPAPARCEIAALSLTATGLTLDHVNAHKHFHLHPTIAGLILKIGARHGLRAARVPFEPDGVLSAIEPDIPRPLISPMNGMARALRARFRRAGVLTPDQVFGMRWSGAMTSARLRALVERLPPGLTEIYLHPAVRDRYPGSAPGYRYADELAALVAPEVAVRLARSNIRRGGFLDFAP
jgi:predicted glycoside hydrolase/deacetylase ChbG (UPF0249 family)